MRAISDEAANKMQRYIQLNGFGDDKALLDYAYALATHYGEAIGALSVEMYEATAEAQNVIIAPAQVAPTPEYGEMAKTVHGTMKVSKKLVAQAVGRMVKRTGADTTLMNAKRDRAQFAWIPSGDSCAFCIALASRGWQDQSKETLKNGHAEHIHANCDCNYSVRFDGKSTVEGYDPQEYLDMYNNAAPDGSPQDKVNALRRQLYAEKREKAKEAAELLRITEIPASTIIEKVKKGEYSLKLSRQQYNKHREGTREYQTYEAARIEKGDNAQSRLLIEFDEAQDIIEKYSGTGIIKTRKDGTALNVEQITCDKTIGEYWQKGEWVKTSKAALHHGSKGTHIVPIKGNNYD